MSSPPLPSATVMVAQLVRPHGVSGEALLAPSTDVPERLTAGAALELVEKNGTRRAVRLAAARPQGALVRVRFDPSLSREELLALRGATLEVSRDAVPPAPAGSYYQFELLGCRVTDRLAGPLGEVVDVVMSGGGGLLLLVRAAPSGEAPASEILVPFIERFLEHVDPAARRIDVDLPVGFVEACASRS